MHHPDQPHPIIQALASDKSKRIRISCKARPGMYLAVSQSNDNRDLVMMDKDEVERLANPLADWYISPADGPYVHIVNVGSQGRSNGERVIAFPGHGGGNQQWSVSSMDDSNQRWAITARHSGKALNLGSDTQHDDIHQWSYHGSVNQTWCIHQL
ncbi:ricin B lectin domain-containing protein [Entophlyctis helioformis]|nr:ricin B lectin domain-containing protein [Entophlyctis helioformis]